MRDNDRKVIVVAVWVVWLGVVTGSVVASEQALPVDVLLRAYLGPEGADHWKMRCRYRGATEGCALIDARILELWQESACRVGPGIPEDRLNLIRYLIEFEPRERGFSIERATRAWGSCAFTHLRR